MVHYKLLYYDFRGRAEFIRYIFHQAGVPFEDPRISFSDDWPKIKPTTPMGKVPVLYVDGQALCNSTTIGMYLAGQFGLAGANAIEEARCDMLACGVEDFRSNLYPWVHATLGMRDADKAKAVWDEVKAKKLPDHLKAYSKFLQDNGGIWFVGSNVTWADLVIAEYYQRLQDIDPTALEGYPLLQEHCKRVHQLPNIQKYTATRPKTTF